MRTAATLLLVLTTAVALAAPRPFQVESGGIARPLSERPGDPEAGREAFVRREHGHCLLCHRVASLDAPFQGNLGPDLSRFGERMDIRRARLRLVDASRLNPDTVMPSYYRSEGLNRVATAYRGRTALSAQQIEDILTYLASLKED